MSMFCYQCQEASKGVGCTIRGVCGKDAPTSGLQDQLVHRIKEVAVLADRADGPVDRHLGRFLVESLFMTVTNANFDPERFHPQIARASEFARRLGGGDTPMPSPIGPMAEPNEDLRSLKELCLYGVKGLAAYAEHAAVLGFESDSIYRFVVKALAATTRPLSADALTALVLETGAVSVETMALLDQANTTTYGTPRATKVSLEVGKRPGILVSGHDLRDLAELLEQTANTGIDIYTHSEMLPAHGYPNLKAWPHLVGNYGSAWWQQDVEFDKFNGAILMTTNCIVPVKASYQDRIFTTGAAGWPGIPHLADRRADGKKDFSKLIERARRCPPPTPLETGELTVGFGHNQILAVADQVVDAIKSGAIRRFVVMGGCDGRFKERQYFTDMAKALPRDAVILTAGCAKYRYNKLDLGSIGGIPRVLDAGQCNDSYSLAVVALKLKEVFGANSLNDLPISFDIGWYEQKAVAVLLALLHLGIKNIRIGPTLPAFVSPGVLKTLVEVFGLGATTTVEADLPKVMGGA